MGEPRILWADLRLGKDGPGIHDKLPASWKIEVVDNGSDVDDAISTHQPDVLCIDYDMPELSDIKLLENIRIQYPWLPVVILMQDQSVEMAVWALRLRVWDYFIKPLEIDNLISRFMESLEFRPENCRHQDDCRAIQPSGFHESSLYGTNIKKVSTAIAALYIRDHLDMKISLEFVASLCGMSKSHFSRSFKNDHGITFQEFLVQQRIETALALLKDTDQQVTQVAFAVGFTELSNFTRTFQRHIGMSPSYYRKAITSQFSQCNDGSNQSTKFPKANPNPVLSVGSDGIPQFVNPAASHLLKEIGLQNIEYILPGNHRMLVKTCLETSTPMCEERKISRRTIIWSYCPVEDSEIVYLYGNDVSDYLTGSPSVKRFFREDPNPVLSLERDGVPRFINPATSRLLEDFEMENIEDILPSNHKSLVKACLITNTPLTDERVSAGRTIVWSYHPTNNNDAIYIYGQEIAVRDQRKQ